MDIAQEASEAFGLGETPVLFARYPRPQLEEPELLQPTNLLKPPMPTRTRATSIEFTRIHNCSQLDDIIHSSDETISGGFKATERSKNENTVPCVFKWTPDSAAALAKSVAKESFVLQKVSSI